MKGSQAAEQQRAKVAEFQRRHRVALLTIVFTDMVNSTELKTRLGDLEGVRLIQHHHAELRKLIAQFEEAEEINTAGDSFFLVFAKPSDAVKFALRLRSIWQGLAPEDVPPPDRVGIHVGEVIIQETVERDKDLFGVQVDACARIMSLGEGGQILLSRAAFDHARPALKGWKAEELSALFWTNHGPYRLKGVDEPIEICEVGETRSARLTPPLDSEKAYRIGSADSEPVLGWRPAVGQRVPETQWVLQNELGEGGFGEVWVGHHPTLKERRVFKFCFRADRIRSLKREMTLFRLLKEKHGEHPNIVAVREVNFEKAPFFIEMDYVDGHDLRRWAQSQSPAKIAEETKLEIVAQIGDALAAVHASGVIHRDIKPGNILIQSRSPERSRSESAGAGTSTRANRIVAKLTDFGIGQVLSEEYLAHVTRAGFTQTLPGSVSAQMGTQMYMAPELLAGGKASAQSDIYSLGVVLYQFLVDDFSKPLTTDWEAQIIDPLLRADLARCFAGNQAMRWGSASELAMRLRTLPGRRRAFETERAAAYARERAAYRRGIFRTASVASGIIMLLAGITLFAFHQRRIARAQAIQTGQALVKTYLGNGTRLLDEGDNFGALAWYSRAFALDSEPENWRMHRLRIGSILAGSPRLMHYGPFEGQLSFISASGTTAKVAVSVPATYDIAILNALTAKQLTVISNLSSKPRAVGFEAGNRLVVFTEREEQYFDAQTGKSMGPPVDSSAYGQLVQFNQDNTLYLMVRTEGAAATKRWIGQVIETATGKPIGFPLAMGDELLKAEFKKGASTILASHRMTASAGGAESRYYVTLWDFSTGRQTSTPWLRNQRWIDASLNSNGDRVAVLASSGEAFIYNADSGDRVAGPFLPDGASRDTDRIELSPDGSLLALRSVTWLGTDSQLWEVPSGKAITRRVNGRMRFTDVRGPMLEVASHSYFSQELLEFRDIEASELVGTRFPAFMVRNCGKLEDGSAVWGGELKEMTLFDVSAETSISSVIEAPGEIECARFAPDGKSILVVTTNRLRFHNLNGKLIVESPPHQLPKGILPNFSHSGNRILLARSAWHDGEGVRAWDMGKGVFGPVLKKGRGATLSPDGLGLLTTNPGHWCVWDPLNGNLVSSNRWRGVELLWGCYSLDSRSIAFAHDSGLALWDAESGQQRWNWKEGGYHPTIFFPGNWQIVSGIVGIHFLDVKSGRKLEPSIEARALELFFSSDGNQLLSGDGARLRIWNPKGRSAVTPPIGNGTERVRAALNPFSSDGKIVAGAAYDETSRSIRARAWDSRSGVPLTPWLKHPSRSLSTTTSQDDIPPVGTFGDAGCDLSLDGKRLLTFAGKTVVVWQLVETEFSPADLLLLSELLSGRTLDQTGNLGAGEKSAGPDLLRDVFELLRQRFPNNPLPQLGSEDPRLGIWNHLKGKYPEFFRRSEQRTANWHRVEALRLAVRKRFEAALEHLNAATNASVMTDTDIQLRRNIVELRLQESSSSSAPTRSH